MFGSRKSGLSRISESTFATYPTQVMRRVVATLVLFVIAAGVFTPALAAAQMSADAYACCRRGGAHHCSAMSSASSGGSGFESETPKCPMRCCDGPISTAPVFTVSELADFVAADTSRRTAIQYTSRKAPDAFSSDIFSRGPPRS